MFYRDRNYKLGRFGQMGDLHSKNIVPVNLNQSGVALLGWLLTRVLLPAWQSWRTKLKRNIALETLRPYIRGQLYFSFPSVVPRKPGHSITYLPVIFEAVLLYLNSTVV